MFDHRDPPKDFFNHGGSVEGVIDWNSVGSGKGMIDWNGGGFVEGMTALRSGQLVLIYYVLDQIRQQRTTPDDAYNIPGGNNFRFARLQSVQWGAYSDTEGKSWHGAPMDRAAEGIKMPAMIAYFENLYGPDIIPASVTD